LRGERTTQAENANVCYPSQISYYYLHYYSNLFKPIQFAMMELLFLPLFSVLVGTLSVHASTTGLTTATSRALPEYDDFSNTGYEIFTMADCPGKCLTTEVIDDSTTTIKLDECVRGGENKFWQNLYDCSDPGNNNNNNNYYDNKKSFFKIRHVASGTSNDEDDTWLCIEDPTDCGVCNTGIELVPCSSEQAAWFSYGNLHKTSPKAYFLYSARCWLREGLISVLSTPSMVSKTCPEDHSAGACERLEWNLDHFSKDVQHYEWSFNKVNEQCDDAFLF